MKRIARPLLAALVVCSLALAASAQSAVDARAALSRFPESQAVLFINANRLVNSAMPRVMPPAEYQKMIDEAQKVGFDARGLEYAAIGVRFAQGAPPDSLPEFVGVVRGSFNADSLLMMARMALGAKDKTAFREESYGAKTLLVLDMKKITAPDAPSTGSGSGSGTGGGVGSGTGSGTGEGTGSGSGMESVTQKGFPYPEMAAVALDANTLVFGVPSYVRAAVDSAGGQGGLAASTLDLATRDPQALMSLTANLPENLVQYLQKTGIPTNEEVNRIVSWLRTLSFSVGMDAVNFTTKAAVMTDTPEHAAVLEGMLKMGLSAAEGALRTEVRKQTGNDAAKTRTALSALQSLTHGAQGNTLEVGIAVPQATVVDLIRKEMARKSQPATKSKPRATPRRRTRRR